MYKQVDIKYFNPFLQAMDEVLATFGIKDVKRKSIQFKENMFTNMDITAVLGLIGEVRGNISYSFSADMAKKIAGAMMGVSVPEIDEMAKSAISELSNLITGKGCKILSEADILTDFTTPSLIIGEDIYFLISTVKTLAIDLEAKIGEIQMNIGLEV